MGPINMLPVLLVLASCAVLHSATALPTVTIGFGSTFNISIPVGAKDTSDYVDRASKAVNPNGGSIIFGPGEFILSRQFLIESSNVAISGAGMGKTVLKLANNAAPFKQAGFFMSRRTSNGIMTDITLDGNKKFQKSDSRSIYGRFCVFIAAYRNWTFRRVECRMFQEYGFDPHGIKKKIKGVFDLKSSQFSYGLTIENCSSHDNDWDGITVDQTINVIVRNNVAYNNGRHGINLVTATANAVVEGNQVWNNGFKPPNSLGCGLLADTNQPGFVTNSIIFRNNIVRGQKATGGTCVKGAQNITFVNNRIEDSVTCATFISNAPGVRFTNNTCIRYKKDYLFQKGGVPPLISGNILQP